MGDEAQQRTQFQQAEHNHENACEDGRNHQSVEAVLRHHARDDDEIEFAFLHKLRLLFGPVEAILEQIGNDSRNLSHLEGERDNLVYIIFFCYCFHFFDDVGDNA